MTPTYINSSSSPFPTEIIHEDQDQDHHQVLMFSSNLQASSSSSLSCHIFFDSTRDQSGYYQREIQHQQEANNLASRGGSYDLENESDNGLKLSLRKKEDRNENQSQINNSVKWMSSKMRLMRKMKNSDQTSAKIPTITAQKFEEEDQKQPSSPMETDNSSNSSSNNSDIPVRVCSDCNTTKTPLWRSGPRGPKSLCNACGIRQRKARRAMAAAAAAAASGTVLAAETSSMKAKDAKQR
ncbi:hypothetical protein F0562_029934 [Nyssa sinensis]|uniref:GATA-type domain-containing protein n=1 Tax=Nyssa sinensis TaxID=561372 RepID=A0A5J5AX26_9ASTE|nr:hypothetical protein F0562_029934 [Nyssa sinensis]